MHHSQDRQRLGVEDVDDPVVAAPRPEASRLTLHRDGVAVHRVRLGVILRPVTLAGRATRTLRAGAACMVRRSCGSALGQSHNLRNAGLGHVRLGWITQRRKDAKLSFNVMETIFNNIL